MARERQQSLLPSATRTDPTRNPKKNPVPVEFRAPCRQSLVRTAAIRPAPLARRRTGDDTQDIFAYPSDPERPDKTLSASQPSNQASVLRKISHTLTRTFIDPQTLAPQPNAEYPARPSVCCERSRRYTSTKRATGLHHGRRRPPPHAATCPPFATTSVFTGR